jgi:tRNA threonylcarbamoyladenosine biosynthesis protein TsaE
MEHVIVSHSESETTRLGIRLGRILEPGTVIYLNGTLGSGKTRLVKGIAEGLEIDAQDVNSPTFTICVPHHGRLDLIHMDAYRINDLEEVNQLGLDDYLEEGFVLVVEWADRVRAALPSSNLTVTIEHLGPDSRQFRLSADDLKGESLLSQWLAGPKP